jgi:hypothetical protein
MMERESARHGALALDTRALAELEACMPNAGATTAGDACDEGFQMTA